MHIYMKKIPAKFHADPIWNDGALGFYKDGHPNKNKTSTAVIWDQFLI